MEISIERIKMEIEKIFLTSPNEAYEALKTLEVIEGLPKASPYFEVYQKYAEGDINFLWAAYINLDVPFYCKENLDRLKFANEQEAEIVSLLCGSCHRIPDLDPIFEKIELFDYCMRMVSHRQWKSTFGPFKTTNEKLKHLGIDGNYLLSLGVKPSDIGTILTKVGDIFNTRFPIFPLALLHREVEAEIEKVNKLATTR